MDLSYILNSKKMKLNAKFAVIVLFMLSALGLRAQETAHAEAVETHQAEEKFSPKEMILEHIADGHEFHLWGHTSIPLPVILFTDKGISVFSSAQFHHDNDGKHVVDANGVAVVRYHNKIYYANAPVTEEAHAAAEVHTESASGHDALMVTLDEKGKVQNKRPLDFSITKVAFTMILSTIIMLVVFLSVAGAYKKRQGKAPKGLQSLLEPIIVFVRDDIAIANIGVKYRRYMPLLLTIFFFILINNILGLVPIFPGSANVTGNIAFTFTLAMVTLVATLFSANKYYWKHIFTPPVPFWLYPIMVPVEIIGIISKPFALMVRLFANITAGHIVVLGLVSLVFILKTLAVAPASVLFVVFIDVLEVLVAFLQAYVFTMLTSLFIGMAVEDHH